MANTKVTGDLIASSTIATGNIADNAVTSDKISGITTAHITEGSNLYYTDARADARAALIVDSAPATLDTLNELAAALGDDPNFATTTANSIGLKAPLASPSFTGNATFGGNLSVTGTSIFTGQIDVGSVVPRIDSTFSLGSNSLRFASIYGDGLTITNNATFGGNVNVTSGASYGSGLQVSRTGHPSLSIITGGTSNAYISIAPSGGTYVDAITISDTGNSTFAGDVTVSGGDLTLGTDAIASNINAVGDVLGINVDSNTGGGAGANIQLKTAGTTQLTINNSSSTFAGNVTISQNGANFEHTHSGNGLVLSHHGIGPSNAIVSGDGTYPDNLFINNGGAASDWSNVIITGNVGIGINTPQAPLSFDNIVGSKIDFYHNVTGSDRYGVEVQSSELRIFSGAQGASTGGITFGKKTTSTFTEAMRIRNDGNVGIGTTSITNYGTTYKNLDISGSNGAYLTLIGTTNTVKVDIAAETNAGYAGTKTAHPFRIRTNDVTRLDISSSGDAVFSKNLYAGDAGNHNQGVYINSDNGTNGYGVVRFHHGGTNRNTIHAFGQYWQNGSLFGHATDTLNLDGHAGVTIGPWNDIDAAFVQGVSTYFKNKVGIGTTGPTEMLHIKGGGSGPEVRLEGTWGSHYIRAYNDNWNFLVGGTVQAINIKNNGAVQIGTTNNGSKLNVGGTIAAATNNGASGMVVPRSYGISWGGSTFTHTFDPVALFGNGFRGGQVLFECTGWQRAMNNGYIMWRNAGGSDPIGNGGAVDYVQTAYNNGGQSGSNTISVSTNSGTNNITITFTGWHANSHGFMCRITTNYS